MDRVSAGRHHKQPQRHRRANYIVLERAASDPGSFRRRRIRGAESAAAAFRPREISADRKSGDPLAFRTDANPGQAGCSATSQNSGAGMSNAATGVVHAETPPVPQASLKRFFSPENRYLAPAFITCILLAGHLSFGILESYKKTGIAILAGLLTELI